MYVRAGLVLALLWGAAGCMKMAPSSSSPEYYDYGDGGDYAMAEAAPMEMDESAGFGSRRESRRMARADKGSMAPPSPPGVAGGGAAPAPEVSDGHSPEPAVADDTPNVARHIIYTASMQVSVYNLEDAMSRAETLPEKYGGYVQNMSSSYFIMRIPAANLRAVMDELATMGTVDARTLDAQDVTEEFLDIETRIGVLEGTQKQLLELLTQARTVEEALKVRQALDQITMELEVLKGRLRRLDSLISFSTLTINLVERGPYSNLPSSNDPFPWVDSLGVEATEWK